MRAMGLADALVDRGNRVTIISSQFFHQEKRHRDGGPCILKDGKLRIHLIPSNGYQRNVGIDRLIDHAQLGARFGAFANAIVSDDELPDFIYIGYPPIELASAAAFWARKRCVPFMVNIEDQWPDIFEEVVNSHFRHIVRLALWPYRRLGSACLRRANFLGAVSESYLSWALSLAKRDKNPFDQVVHLAGSAATLSPYERAIGEEFWRERGVDLSHSQRMIFVGSISRGFDFKPLSDAVRNLNRQGVHIEFLICGTGEAAAEVKESFSGIPGVVFPGWIDRYAYAVIAQRAICTLAPYKKLKNFEDNVPNKIIDSLAFGRPVLTSLGGETDQLIRSGRFGFSSLLDSAAWLDAIKAIESPTTHREFSVNANALFVKRFGNGSIYNHLISSIEAEIRG